MPDTTCGQTSLHTYLQCGGNLSWWTNVTQHSMQIYQDLHFENHEANHGHWAGGLPIWCSICVKLNWFANCGFEFVNRPSDESCVKVVGYVWPNLPCSVSSILFANAFKATLWCQVCHRWKSTYAALERRSTMSARRRCASENSVRDNSRVENECHPCASPGPHSVRRRLLITQQAVI